MREIKPLIVSIRNISLRKLKEKEGVLYLYVFLATWSSSVMHSAIYYKNSQWASLLEKKYRL